MSTTFPDPNISPPASNRDKNVLSVSQLNGLAKRLLEEHLPLFWVEGEISNFTQPSSGHWYFTLKDARAQIRCAIFRGRNRDVQFTPKQGDKVLVRGKVSLYEGRGDFQLIAEHMEQSGFGSLQQQFERLKVALNQEGLFAPERKQPLPEHPLHIGIITSPTGAAVRDMLSVLKRRMPTVPVTIVPTPVQGKQAANDIIAALNLAQNSGLFDVLVITRGGGSLEDLWCFNDEKLARAIAECPIPIVNAVGHEIDFTIADFVADVRAPTPSAAAEILSHNQFDLLKTIVQLERQLLAVVKVCLDKKRHNLNVCKARIKHPKDKLQNQSQRLDNLEIRLSNAFTHKRERAKSELASITTQLNTYHPHKLIKEHVDDLAHLQNRLNRLIGVQWHKAQVQLDQSSKRLSTVSPLNTLNRGYAIALNRNGQTLIDANSVEVGDSITVRLAKGELDCIVDKTVAEKKS